MHIFEHEVKEQVDPGVYERQMGFLEMTLETGGVKRPYAAPVRGLSSRARGEA